MKCEVAIPPPAFQARLCEDSDRGCKSAEGSPNMASRYGVPRYLVFVIALAWIGRADDLAPSGEFENKAVAQIRFDPPAQPLPAADLARLVAFRTGAPLHLADVRAAIKRLYGTG